MKLYPAAAFAVAAAAAKTLLERVLVMSSITFLPYFPSDFLNLKLKLHFSRFPFLRPIDARRPGLLQKS